MNQLVNLTMQDCGELKVDYKLNIYHREGYLFKIYIKDSLFGDGYVDLLIKFQKQSNGLVYCKIFQVYAPDKKKLIYNQPITKYVINFYKSITCDVIGYEDTVNFEEDITDEDGNINGKHKVNWIHNSVISINTFYINKQKQLEADKIYMKLHQQEKYYELHKAEIDTIRELAAAYDKMQAGQKE